MSHRSLAGRRTAAALVAISAAAALPAASAGAAAFGANSVVVCRVGTGTGSLVNTGNAVFLDEYSAGGTLLQSIPMPTTVSGANKPLIASGTATSECLISRSADGLYVMVPGYGTTVGGPSLSGTTSAAVPRVVGRVDNNGTVDTTTALTDWASGNNPRSVASSDGTQLWVAGGAGAVRAATLGATTSTDLTTGAGFTNVRQLNIFTSQLFASSGSGTNTFRGVETVGSGLPTSGAQAVTRLTGLTDALNPSTFSFFFADLSSGVAGDDTLYVADDAAGALSKFSLVGGTWVLNNKIGVDADDYRGLTGVVNAGSVTLFATRKGGSGATGGGELVSLVDATGYNASMTATPTLLATAAANTAMRGVALAPISAGPEVSETPWGVMSMIGGAAAAVLGLGLLRRRTAALSVR